ncbi:TPA: ABC transporter permease [Streptococcus suis]
MSKKTSQIAVPLISVFLGLVLGAIIMLIFGYDPLWGYEGLLQTAFGSTKNIGEIFRAMAPLILIALGFSVATRAGFFNIGLSGQAYIGWVLAVWFALENPDMPRLALIPITVLIGMFAGGIVGAIPGFLRAFLGTSEVIVTIMMNYIILYVGNFLVQRQFAPELKSSMDASLYVSKNATYRIDWLSELTNNSRINIGIFMALFATIVIWYMLNKTTLGFEIRSVGLNPNASEYAGMSSKRTIVLSMVISGALAGLAGVVQGLGTFEHIFIQSTSLSIGFDGMAVSLLASNNPVGIIFSAFLFAVLEVGKTGMKVAQVPPEIVQIVSGSIIFFVGASYLVEHYLLPRKAKGGK